MKEQKVHDAKFVWGRLSMNDPYHVIREVFSYADVGFYRGFLKDVLLYSTRKKRYRKEDAGQVLFLLEGVDCMLKACFEISQNPPPGHAEPSEDERYNRNPNAEGETTVSYTWSNFPRALTQAEAQNPYRAFAKVYKHNSPYQWRRTINYLAADACGRYDDFPEENTLKVYLQLSRLFEAAYLVYTRQAA